MVIFVKRKILIPLSFFLYLPLISNAYDNEIVHPALNIKSAEKSVNGSNKAARMKTAISDLSIISLPLCFRGLTQYFSISFLRYSGRRWIPRQYRSLMIIAGIKPGKLLVPSHYEARAIHEGSLSPFCRKISR